MSGAIRRYTDLPFLLDFLRTKEIALLSPLSWDDKNDSFYLDAYARAKGLTSVFALCLTEASETYHHWKVFAPGSSGMCIVFKKDRLIEWVQANSLLHAGPVSYKTLKDMRASGAGMEELPFLKRHAFKDEMEFRIFTLPQAMGLGPMRFPIPLSTIDRIVMNPWLPKGVAEHVKATIKQIPGCQNLKVYRSTLVDNEDWKKFAAPSA